MALSLVMCLRVSLLQLMEAGPAGVPGPAVTSAVAAGVPSGHAPAPVLHPRTVAKNVKERRIKSSPATPNLVVN